MPIQHNIEIAGETYTNIDSLQINGANSEEGKTIEYICPEWDNLSFDDTTPILGTHTTDKDGFKTVTIESDDLKSANIIESATIFGVEGAIPINEDADITVHGNRLTVPAGYYPNMTARTVDNGTLTVTKDFDVDTGKFTASAKVTKNGYLTSADNTSTEIQLDTTDAKTIYPSTREQIAVPANRYTLGEIKVAAMEYASGSLGGDAYNGKATPDIRYDSVEGIKTTKPSGSDFITIGASVKTEPAGYAPKYNVLQAGYIGTSLYADKENIPVTAGEDKVIYIETDDGTTVTPSTAEQTIELTGKLMQGDIVVEAMPEGTLADIELNNNNGKIEASLSISKPGYVDNTDRKTAELTLPSAQLTWTVGTVAGGCEAKITNQDNIRTVSANHDGDYYTIKATAIGNDGEAGLDVTNFTAGYLSTNPIEGSSYVGVPVTSDTVGKEIHIPKATLSTSGATVSVTEAGYLPAGESQTVQSGAYKANATATANLSISANNGNIKVSQQPSKEAASSGYYFKVSGTAYARADASAEVTKAGYVQTGQRPAFDETDTSATTYYTIAEGSATTPNTRIQVTPVLSGSYMEDLGGYEVFVSKDQALTPTVEEGYVESGTSGNIHIYGASYIPKATFSTSGSTVKVTSAGYIPKDTSVGNVQTVERASTDITVTQEDINTLTITAVNDQKTGYVEGSSKSDSTTITLTASGPTVTATASDGTTASQKVKEASRASTTLQAEVISENEITLTARNEQSEGYTMGGLRSDQTTITQSVDGPTVTATVEGKSISATIPNGALSDISLIDNNGTIEADLYISTPGYISNSVTEKNTLKLPDPVLSIGISPIAGNCEIKLSNENNIATVDDSYTGDSYLIKATTTVNDGQAYLANTGTFQAGYLRSHPVTDTSGVAVGVNVTNNEKIRIPKAKFNTSRATVSVASAGYIPKGEVVGSINSYTGDTNVTPGMNSITLQTQGKYLDNNIVIQGDTNLKSSYIKKDVTIFGITGTYEAIPDYKLSGKWQFIGSNISSYSLSSTIEENVSYYVYHQDSTIPFSSIKVENVGSSGGNLLYYGSILAYASSAGPGFNQGWQGGTSNWVTTPDIIEFSSEQKVSVEFYNWFTSVAELISLPGANGFCSVSLQAMGWSSSLCYYDGSSTLQAYSQETIQIECNSPIIMYGQDTPPSVLRFSDGTDASTFELNYYSCTSADNYGMTTYTAVFEPIPNLKAGHNLTLIGTN